MKSPLISGNRTVEDILREHLKEQCDAAAKPAPRARGNPPSPAVSPAPSPRVPSTATSLADYIKLENISCVDADGTVFEKYDTLYVRKDNERNADKSQKSFTPYQGAVYFEQQGVFLPSFALSCAILAQLYQHKSDPDINTILMQYKDKRNQTGWHVQNTIINYKDGKVIHYPHDGDFPNSGGTNNINQASSARRENAFVKSQSQARRLRGSATVSLGNCTLEEGLKNSVVSRFVKQLTGLENPAMLVEIGKYFQKPAYIWFPQNVQQCEETRAAWLGCNVDGFDLDADDYLGNTYAARGVRLGMP